MSPAAYSAFAITAPGLAPLVATELRDLGVRPSAVHEEGVAFRASARDVWRVNLWSRVASRVVVRAGEFHAETFYELERRAKRLDWGRFLAPGARVRLRVTCRKSRLYHSDAVAERVASGIVAAGGLPLHTAEPAVMDETALDPLPGSGGSLVPVRAAANPEMGAPTDQLVIVRIAHDRCTISIDSSGELLHRRGYRLETAKAPLRETLAAAVLIASGWTGQAPLVDPLCGSGTLLIEAALLARHRAPGLDRAFAFMRWPDFNQTTWQDLVARAHATERPPSVPISGSDRDAGAIAAATHNATRAGVQDDILLARASISAALPGPISGWIISNPPYGVRVGDRAGLRALYARLAQVVRTRFCKWTVVLVSADRALLRATGLAWTTVLHTVNGGIPVEVVRTTDRR